MSIPSLTATSGTSLGAKLIQSAAYFETGAAELIAAEGEKLQKLVRAASNHSITFTTLYTTVNPSIRFTVSALSSLEASIMRKISAGTHLHNATATQNW